MRHPEVETSFARMIRLGENLLEAQRLEESFGKVCARHSTPADLEGWKEARRWVEAFAESYCAAVREWREEIESEISREVPGTGFPLALPDS